MASYEEIHGKRVETFSSDPTLDSSYEGQVWFNSTSGILKTVVASAAWASASPMTNTVTYSAGGNGALYSPPNTPGTNQSANTGNGGPGGNGDGTGQTGGTGGSGLVIIRYKYH